MSLNMRSYCCRKTKPLKAARSTHLLRQTGKQHRVKVLKNFTADSSVVWEELRASEGHPASAEDPMCFTL